jgi:hypothetical protein
MARTPRQACQHTFPPRKDTLIWSYYWSAYPGFLLHDYYIKPLLDTQPVSYCPAMQCTCNIFIFEFLLALFPMSLHFHFGNEIQIQINDSLLINLSHRGPKEKQIITLETFPELSFWLS